MFEIEDISSPEYENLSNEIYEMIATIETQIHFGDIASTRTDSFKDFFERIFGISIDKIDDVESIIQERDNSEDWIGIYKDIRNHISGIYDKYLGIKFNYDDINETVDLNGLYSVYKIIYVNFFDIIAKIMAYIIVKNNNVFDISKNTVFEDILKSEEEFNLDTIPQILELMDPGNIDNEYVFGESQGLDENSSTNNKVSLDLDILIKHLLMELKLGAGISNTEFLRSRILFYIKYIEQNNIL